ncbi:MAG: ribosomal protein S6 [Candidatus Paceibacteria bacterium]
MAQIYEGMFLIDNAVVRESWDTAKKIVTGILEKHGATILSARRWDERHLSYPIKGKNRATFLLTYYSIPGDEIPAMRRDFELTESVLRSLELCVDAIPESEAEFVTAEGAEDFKVPTPPDDDHVDYVEEVDTDYGDRPRRDDDRNADSIPDFDVAADETAGSKSAGAAGSKSEESTKETVEATEEN